MRVANSIDSLVSDPTLPPEVEDGSAWYGSDLAKCDDWIEHLSPAEVAEVEHALRQLDAKRTDFTSITASDVPLPTLAPRLQRILDEVLYGRGFVLIKGLPVELWTKREAAIAFLAIGVHLGNLRMQNAEGHLLGHVRDLGRSSNDPNTRIYQTRERQTHHTDSCDVVGLLCVHAARSGGLSNLVSSTTIFNEIRRRGPTYSESCSIQSKRIDAVKSPKAANRISRFPCSTITKDWFPRFTKGNTSSRPDAFRV